jgi:glycine/D-amino acid oxidase-like deaminating enzyme
MGVLRRRAVSRGSNILDGRVIAQDLDQGLASAGDALVVEQSKGKAARDKAVVALNPQSAGAAMALSYLQVHASLKPVCHDGEAVYLC